MFYNCFVCRYHFNNTDSVLIAECGHFCCEKCASDLNSSSICHWQCGESFCIAKGTKPIAFEKGIPIQTNILLTKLLYASNEANATRYTQLEDVRTSICGSLLDIVKILENNAAGKENV